MSDYTPTDGDVREAAAGGLVGDLEDNYEAFDRWLAEVKAAAWKEGVAASDAKWERNAEFEMSGREPLTNPHDGSTSP